MKSASLKIGMAATLALLSGCATGPLGLDLGAGAQAGVGAVAKLVVDSLAGPVDLAKLPAPATTEAAAGNSLVVGVASLDRKHESRALQMLGLSLGADGKISVSAAAAARAEAKGKSEASASTEASGSAEAEAVAEGDAGAHAKSEAKTQGWVFQEIAFRPTRVEVHMASGASGSAWISLPITASGSIDLVSLDATSSAALLASAQLQAGHYDQIRLWSADTHAKVESEANTYIAVDGSGTAHTGVYTLPGNVLTTDATFDIKADTQTNLTFALDAKKSMHLAGRKAILFPHALEVEAAYEAAAQSEAQVQ